MRVDVGQGHADSRDAVAAERGFLGRLDGGCQVPIAAFARLDGDSLTLDGLVADPEDGRTFRDAITGPRSRAAALGAALADTVLAMVRVGCERPSTTDAYGVGDPDEAGMAGK